MVFIELHPILAGLIAFYSLAYSLFCYCLIFHYDEIIQDK